MNLLTVDDVTLRYGNGKQSLTAVDSVRFQVVQSDRYVILGPSGCGKSTLLRAIGGYIQPAAGTILLDGKPVRAPGPDRIFVFQELDQLLP
jgi:NitT/TauT family transport system ATP-binding protein